MSSKNKSLIVNLLIVIGLLLLWEFLVSNPSNVNKINSWVFRLVGWNPHLKALSLVSTPKPSSIVRTFFVTPDNGRGGPFFFWMHMKATITAILPGFVIGNFFAIIMATVFLYVPALERALMPFSLAARSVPLVAITPLLLRIRFSIADLSMVQNSPILYPIFGTERAIKMLIVVIVVFFPTLVNVYQGLRSVERPAIELMQSLSASPWYIFWNLRVPSALPMTFSALKIAASSSVGGVIIAEWLSSNRGLGYVMYTGSASATLSTATMWVAVVISTMLSFVMFWVVNIFEKISIPWHESVIALREVMDGLDAEVDVR